MTPEEICNEIFKKYAYLTPNELLRILEQAKKDWEEYAVENYKRESGVYKFS